MAATTKGKPSSCGALCNENRWPANGNKAGRARGERRGGGSEGNPRGCVPGHPDRRFNPYRFA